MAKERVVSLPELWKLSPGYKRKLVFGFIVGLFAGFGFPAFANLMGDIFATFTLPPDELRSELLKTCLILAGVAVVWFVAIYASSVQFTYVGHKSAHNLKAKFFLSMMNKPISFFDNNKGSDLLSKMAEEGTLVQDGIGDKVGSVWFFGCQFVLSLGIAFYRSWSVTLALLAVSPLMIVSGVLNTKATFNSNQAVLAVEQQTSNLSQQSFSAVKTVKAFSAEDVVTKKFADFAKKPFQAGIKRSKTESFAFTCSFALIFITYGLGLYIAGIFVANGRAEPPEVLAALFSVIFALQGISTAGTFLPDVTKGLAAATSLYKLIEEKEDNLNETGLVTEVNGGIKLENITFRYPTRKDVTVLENFSLEIKPNTSVALVGTSGGGKSTIVNLVQRFYEPELGQVLIDNVPISDLNLTAFRRQVALVEQHPKLFSGTIRENILFGLFGTGVSFSEKELDEKVIKACKDANAYDFIMDLPKGFDTELAEGKELSGGQMQRISIARALIREPKILLLDEPTSALDSQSERQVQEVLDEMMTRLSCTLIVIAHRLSTVKNASKIVVINRGLIAEGTHEELLETSEDYRKLTQGQMIGFADGSNSE
ncbi:hypothetical protein RCL1_006923 [Eukaryota sp. TZLM3-RCL]